MIERLSFAASEAYSALEGAIHLGRYSLAQPLCAGKRVLDLGCGEGYGSSFLATRWGAREVHAVDVSAEAIGRARELFADGRITFHCRPAEDLDAMFDAGSFDLIVCLETIEHVADAGRLLRSFQRLKSSDGALVVSCPNDWWYYPTPDTGNPYHLRKFTWTEFRGLSESILGPASQVLFGMPVAGFANVVPDGAVLRAGAGEPSPVAMFRAQPRADATLLPADEDVTEKNCSYFVGIWGGAIAAESIAAFPCSMDRVSLAREQQVIQHLRDELARLRQDAADLPRLQRAVRDAELRAAAWRAECEYVRQVLADVKGPTNGVRRSLPGPRQLAHAVLGRLRRAIRG